MAIAVPEIVMPNLSALDLLQRRIPARDIASMTGVSVRQVRKARTALTSGHECEALNNFRSLPGEFWLDKVERLESPWIAKDMRLSAEHRVYESLLAYRKSYEIDRAAIWRLQAVYLSACAEVDADVPDCEQPEQVAAMKKSQVAYDEKRLNAETLYNNYLKAHAHARELGIIIEHHSSVSDFRDLMQQKKPERPKHKKGGKDVFTHRKVSERTLREAAGL